LGTDIDPQVLERLAAYDERAQLAFWNENVEPVHAYVSKALAKDGRKEDAEEIVQDAFDRAFRDIGKFRGQSSVTTWLFALARHAATDYYRSPKNRYAAADPERFSSLDDPRAARRTAQGDTEGLSGLLLKERHSVVGDQLKALQREHREVVTLRIFQKVSTTETAQILGRSEGAVKMLLVRALREMRERLGANPYFETQRREGGGGLS